MAVAYRQLRGFHVYCDESNTDSGKRHPIYGGILVSVNNLATVDRAIAHWRAKEQMHGELAWTKVDPGRYAKYKSLVDLFLILCSTDRLMHFKAIVLDTGTPEYRTFSRGDKELGFYKFYYHFLLRYFAKFADRHRCQMEVIIDERPVKGDPTPFSRSYSTAAYGKNLRSQPTWLAVWSRSTQRSLTCCS